MSDEFAPESGNGYDPDKIYFHSRDSKGFGTTIRLTIPPSVLGEISSTVAGRTIPEYRTNHDFFRDAIVHRLHQVKDRDPNLAGAARLMTLMAEGDRWKALEETHENIFRIAEKMVNSARTEQEKRLADVYLTSAISNFSSDSHWFADLTQLRNRL